MLLQKQTLAEKKRRKKQKDTNKSIDYFFLLITLFCTDNKAIFHDAEISNYERIRYKYNAMSFLNFDTLHFVAARTFKVQLQAYYN